MPLTLDSDGRLPRYPIRRPWRQFLNLSSFTCPYTLGDIQIRLSRNNRYFNTNYTIVLLAIIFLSLLYHPISLIVFLIVAFLWYFFYFSRESPLVVLGCTIDERVVVVGLSLLTVLGVGSTGVWSNVSISIGVGVVCMLVHGVFRGVDDLYCDEEGGSSGGLASVVSSGYIRI